MKSSAANFSTHNATLDPLEEGEGQEIVYQIEQDCLNRLSDLEVESGDTGLQIRKGDVSIHLHVSDCGAVIVKRTDPQIGGTRSQIFTDLTSVRAYIDPSLA